MRETSTRCVDSLLSACADGDGIVREQVIASLCQLANRDFVGVIRQCEQWLTHRKPSTTSSTHRWVVIKAILAILKEHRSAIAKDQLPSDMRDALVACAFSEMTSNANDLTSDWAKESCNWMVEMCGLYPKHGMQQLLGAIPASALPHYYVVQAIADAADVYPARTLPYVKEAMAKLLPILSLAKQDNQRMAFAQALGNLSDAVVRCVTEQATTSAPPTPRSKAASTATFADFSDSMYAAIQFLVGDWSRSSEARVRIPVVFALGSMMAVCTAESRVALLPKLLPLIIAGVKREKPRDVCLPCKGLASMLSFASDEVALSLQPHMEATILPQLFQTIAAVMADAKESAASLDVKKSLAAALAVAERVAEFYVDGLTTYISKMLDAKSTVKDPAMKASAMQVLRHLISRPSLEPRLEPYKDGIIATVKLAQNDSDWRVRQGLAACVVAMGNSNVKFFEAMGGSDLLTYVIRSAAVTDASPAAEELRDSARNTLALFSQTTGGKLDLSLWPFLLEHFNEHAACPSLLTVLPTVCRCLVQIGSRVCQSEHYYVDFSVAVNVPRPHQLAAKFLVQAMQVEHYAAEELHTLLECMVTLAPLLDDPFSQTNTEEIATPVANVWLSLVPELQSVLMSGDERQLAVGEWEDLCSKLVTKTMTCKQSEQWVEDVTAAATQQLQGYQHNALMYRSTLVVIGIGIGRSSKKDFVATTVDHLIDAANHDNAHHRTGLAKAFGYIAALHPDLVSDKLGALAKGPEKRGFFASRDKNKKELVEASRCIAAYGLCYAARRMQPNIFASRLDAVIIPTLTSIVSECKMLEVREPALDAVALLDLPLQKQSGAGAFVFKGRDAFIEALLKSVPLDVQLKAPPNKLLFTATVSAMRALHALVSSAPAPPLAPAVSEKCCSFVLQFITRGWLEVDAAAEVVGRQAAATVLADVFRNHPKLDVDSIVPALLQQTVSTKDIDRERAVYLLAELFECCADRAEKMISEGVEVKSAVTIGPLLGRLIPRVMDTIPAIRQLALDGIEALLRIISCLLPEMTVTYEIDIPGCVAVLESLRGRLSSLIRDGTQSSEKEVASITKALCLQVVSALPDPSHFASLLDTLLAAGITDPQDDAASCSCVVLHGMIRGLGSTISETNAKRHLEDLLEAVEKVKSREQSLQGVLVSVRNIAKHHSVMAFNAFLRFDAPHSEALVKSIQAVVHDGTLATLFVQHALDLLLNSQLVEDRPDAKDKKKLVRDLAVVPLSAACAFGWMTGDAKGAEAVIAHRADVYGSLLLYLTAAHDFGDAAKVAHVVKALQLVVDNTAAEVTVDRMERFGWSKFNDSKEFPRATMELVKYLCREELGDTTEETDRGLVVDAKNGLPLEASEPTSLAIEIAQFMLPYANKPIKSHRRAAIHVCTMLLQYSLGEKKLLQSLATTLLGRSGSDEDVVLRAETLCAFPNLCVHEYAHAQVYVSPMLSALISNFSDASLLVSCAAMRAAIQLMHNISEKEQISPIAVNIILKAKPLFESRDKEQRRLAYDVYNTIVKLGNEGHMEPQTMEQQVYLHLATLLVHAEEDDDDVRQSVKHALHGSAQWICDHTHAEAASSMRSVFAKPLVQVTAKMNYDDFANDFAFTWVAHFGGRVNDLLVAVMGFFAAEREPLRGAAVCLSGYILKHIPPADMGRAHVDQLCNALIATLNPSKEKSAAVRMRAAKALGLLREL